MGTTLRCPKCGSADGLWLSATQSGWVPLDADGSTGRWECDGYQPEVEDYGGCGECSWEGDQRQMTATTCANCGKVAPEQPVDGCCSRSCQLQHEYAQSLSVGSTSEGGR
jgi:hypothetical protein